MVDKQRVGKIKGSREMLVTVISSFVLMSGIFIPIVESGINTVGPLDFCEGKQGVIPWNYTVDNLFSATWLKGSDTLMVFAFGLLTITPGKDVELDSSVSNGALKLLTVDANSGGLYTCTVIYDVEPAVNDIVNVSVITDQPGEPTHTKVDKTITCGSNSTTTMVTKRIKIDGVLSSAESASVEDKNTVECCFIGSEAKCADGNLDKTVLYCKVVQTGGTTATSSPPAPTTSTTASATTVTSTIPISKTTTSSTTTTMTTLPNATNPATTTATAPKVSTSTTGSTSIRTATQEISTSTTTRSSITTTMAANSDKGVIIMIIVVSVIGGILVIAIIFMLFLLGHWKNGFVQIGHKKHALNSSHRYVGHRIHQMKRKHKTTTGRSEHSTFQPYHKSGDYSFYRGVQNPVFDETLDKPISQDVYRHTPEMTHSLQYNECQPEHPYNKNWEEM